MVATAGLEPATPALFMPLIRAAATWLAAPLTPNESIGRNQGVTESLQPGPPFS